MSMGETAHGRSSDPACTRYILVPIVIRPMEIHITPYWRDTVRQRDKEDWRKEIFSSHPQAVDAH